MSVLIVMIGALWRRIWGGWFSPNSAFKRIVTVILAALVGFYTFGMSWMILLPVVSITFSFLMPYHGYGMGMGYGSAQRAAWKCFSVMLLQYGGVTALTGLAWYMLEPNTGGLLYTPLGCIVPLGYWLSWFFFRDNLAPFGQYPNKNYFYDGPTCFGELVLGAVIIGGYPFCKYGVS